MQYGPQPQLRNDLPCPLVHCYGCNSICNNGTPEGELFMLERLEGRWSVRERGCYCKACAEEWSQRGR